MPFTVEHHDLLSEAAKALNNKALTQQMYVAAELLGLAEYEDSLSGNDTLMPRVARALVLQINAQVFGGVEAALLKSEDVDDMAREYNGPVSAAAQVIAANVLDKAGLKTTEFGVIRSRR